MTAASGKKRRGLRDLSWPRLLAFCLLGSAALIPLIVNPRGSDIFRLPKELALYTAAILAITIVANGIVLGGSVDRAHLRRLRLPIILSGAGLLWMLFSTIFSTNRSLSGHAFFYVLSAIVVFLGAAYALRRVSADALSAAILFPALVNALIVWSQASGLWNPWVFPAHASRREMNNALLGNVNDVGAYLVPAVVLAVVAALFSRRWRWMYIASAAILAGALILTQTITAIAAATVALGALVIHVFRTRSVSRTFAWALAAVLLFLLAAPLFYAPLRQRVRSTTDALTDERLNQASSNRLLPFATAWDMVRTRPLVGMGPGSFKFNYMDFSMRVQRKHPRLFAAATPMNFGETHNDHLQVLAETGVVGYLILLAAAILIVRQILRGVGADDDVRVQMAKTMALPMLLALGTNMIAGFPLQLAAPTYTYALLAGAGIAWSSPDALA